MPEPRAPYRTGTEAEMIKESALRDLKTAILQCLEAGITKHAIMDLVISEIDKVKAIADDPERDRET